MPGTRCAAHSAWRQHPVRRAQRQQAQCGARPVRRRGLRPLPGPGRRRRHRRGHRGRRARGHVRDLGRGAGGPLPAPGDPVDHRLRCDGFAVVLACHRSRVVRDVWRVVAVRPHHRHPGAAAGRHRVGDRRRSGGMGRARGLLQSIALRHRRLHRLLLVRCRRDGARSRVRRARAGRRRRPSQRAVAGPAEEPGRVPDLSVPGRLRPAVCDGAAAVARPAALAGGAGGVSGPEIRRDRCAVRGLAADQRADRRSCSPDRP